MALSISLLRGGKLNGTTADEYKWRKGLKKRYWELVTS